MRPYTCNRSANKTNRSPAPEIRGRRTPLRCPIRHSGRCPIPLPGNKLRAYQPGRISAECLVGTSVNSAARHDAINAKTISMTARTHIQPSNTRSRVSKREGGPGIATETERPAPRVDGPGWAVGNDGWVRRHAAVSFAGLSVCDPLHAPAKQRARDSSCQDPLLEGCCRPVESTEGTAAELNVRRASRPHGSKHCCRS